MITRRTYSIGLAIIAAAIVFASTGGSFLTASTAGQSEGQADGLSHDLTAQHNLPRVAVLALSILEEIELDRQFLGRLEAGQSASIGFDHAGRIESLAIREGDTLRAGDLIATLRTGMLEVERQALAARVNSLQERLGIAESETTRLSRLVERGAVAANTLDRARAGQLDLTSSLAQAETDLQRLEMQLADTRLTAPMDGTVGAVRVAPDEAVTAGQPVIELFHSDAVHVRVGLPMGFDQGRFDNFEVVIDGESFVAELLSLRSDITPATNTRDAVFLLPDAALGGFGRGVSLRARERVPMRGAWVPFDALRPSAEGSWTLLALSDDMIARRLDVDVLHQRGGQAFVAGDFSDGQRIIATGVQRIVPGQPVRVD